MKFLNHRVMYSVLFYVLIIILVIVSKPSFIFRRGKLISFGVGPNKTIFPLGVTVVALSIISFYIFALIDIFVAK